MVAVLTRKPVLEVQRIDLCSRRSHAAARMSASRFVDYSCGCRRTWPARGGRRAQIATLLALLEERDSAPLTVLMGDLNEWLLGGHYGACVPFRARPCAPTFPSHWRCTDASGCFA